MSAIKSENKAGRDLRGRFLKGQAPKSPGRPLGSISIKDRVRQWLEENPDDMSDFVKHFAKKNRELAWQMLEGRPQQDVTTAGQKIEIPIYGGRSIDTLPGHNGNKDDIQADEED